VLVAFVRVNRPDKIAVFAIRPVHPDIGGYGGSPPRETTDVRVGDLPRPTGEPRNNGP